MLNLDDLTDEERTTILAVLKKEDIVRKTEDRKISNLKTEIQGLRMKSVLRDGDDLSKICARCHTPFGVFFNRGDVCVKCRFRVCKMCQENLLNGKWLCILCYKQRQLKWFLGDWSMETPSRWPSGADLVKASLKLTPISINTNIDDDQVEPSHIKQHSGSESDSQGREAVEFPNQNDQRKLAHLFGTLQNQQKSDKKDKNLIIRRKVGSKKYSDSESDTGSSDSEEYRIQQNRIPPSKQNASSYPAKKTNDSIQQYKDMTSKSRARKELPSSDVQGRKTNIHYQSDNQKGGLHEREKINRNNIDTSTSRAKSESEVTLESYSKESSNNKNKPDLENFVDSVPSSPVKDNSSDKCDLDISDVSSHDKMSYQLNSQKKFRQSATEVVMAMKLSPQNSLSTQKSEISEYSQPSVPRQLRSYDERSNSPFSFDSLPSSHANSPLPRRHFLTESVSGKDSSDTECVSSVSGGDDSGTESHVTSHSGTEDYVEEELSKVRFRRMSVKTIQSSYPNASDIEQNVKEEQDLNRDGIIVTSKDTDIHETDYAGNRAIVLKTMSNASSDSDHLSVIQEETDVYGSDESVQFDLAVIMENSVSNLEKKALQGDDEYTEEMALQGDEESTLEINLQGDEGLTLEEMVLQGDEESTLEINLQGDEELTLEEMVLQGDEVYTKFFATDSDVELQESNSNDVPLKIKDHASRPQYRSVIDPIHLDASLKEDKTAIETMPTNSDNLQTQGSSEHSCSNIESNVVVKADPLDVFEIESTDEIVPETNIKTCTNSTHCMEVQESNLEQSISSSNAIQSEEFNTSHRSQNSPLMTDDLCKEFSELKEDKPEGQSKKEKTVKLVEHWLETEVPLPLECHKIKEKSVHDLDMNTHNLPLLSLQDQAENSEQDRKLSPRASSEGSLEDSGHVSGASTQENTPIHKRTDSLQSQLSMPSTLSTVTDQSSEETDIDDLVAYHRPLSRTGNLLTTIADSKESILSFYSNAGEVDYGKIPITGEIEFSLEYNYRTGTLEIRIKRCKDLAPAEPKKNRSDPYVKTYLLPDKTRSGKRKTRIKKNTLNPVFEETLRYLISKSELENRTLWVTVWHSDKFGRNDFLGEVTINFSYFRFGDSAAKWYILQEKMDANPPTAMTYRGDIFLSIRFVPPEKIKMEEQSMSPKKKSRKKNEGRTKGQLQVTIKEARNLMAVKSGSYSDPFIKGYLLPDKTKNVKQKTVVVKHSCNPTFNHTFIFDDVSHEELRERCLELTVWDHDKLSSNEFLGGVRLNLGMGRSYSKNVEWMDARGEEISLWQAMIDRPYIWIDGAIILRPNMDKRKA